MTPAQRLAYNLASRGIIATRSGKAWTLLQTDTATATRALFDPAVIDSATWRKLSNGSKQTFTTKEASRMIEA